MKILATAKQRGSVNVLAPVVRELERRAHEVEVYATGNENEAAGFGDIPFQHIQPKKEDYSQFVKGHDAVLVGLSGYNTPDGYFLRAANDAKIPAIAVLDQNTNYKERLEENPDNLPSIIAVMDDDCTEKIEKEIGGEAAKRCKVIGWTAFDHYSQLRESFTEKDRTSFLQMLDLDSSHLIYTHFTQNFHPSCEYIKNREVPFEKAMRDLVYEVDVTGVVFEAASDLGLKLTVKPHPGEKFSTNYTENLAKRHGFVYIPAKACNTQNLMLASHSVTAGRSTCLTEACLLDINTGGILPSLNKEDISAFPPIELNAIPYVQEWSKIQSVLSLVTSSNEETNKHLADKRKKFSVDGKASQRLVDLIEDL